MTANQAPAPWRVPLSGGPLSGGPLSGISAASIIAVLLNLFFNEWKAFRNRVPPSLPRRPSAASSRRNTD